MSDAAALSSEQSRTSTRPAPPDGDRAIPARYWWLKRIALGVLALFVLLLLLRLWWGHIAERRFQAELASYRAAGQPVEPEDFNPPPIDDEDNAALLYIEAANAITLPKNAPFDVLNWATSPEHVRQHPEETQKWIDANAKPLELVHRARGLPGVVWPWGVQSPMIASWSISLSAKPSQRQLAKLLAVSALHDHFTGNHELAVASVRDMLALASAMDREPWLISRLVAIAVRDLTMVIVEAILPELAIAGGPGGNPDCPPAVRRSRMEELLAELLDEADIAAAVRKTCYAERAIVIDTCRLLSSGELGPSGLIAVTGGGGRKPASLLERAAGFPFMPIVQLDTLTMCRRLTLWADAVTEPTWPAAAAAAPPDPERSEVIEALQHPFSAIFDPSLKRATILHYRIMADQRMCAVATALRLYRLDHESLPERLDALVPDYLEKLPLDPFAADGRPFGYLPNNERPILYSVGQNGLDEGGAVRIQGGSRVDYDDADRPFFLDGRRPTRPDDVPAEMLKSSKSYPR